MTSPHARYFQVAYRGVWEGRPGWFIAFRYDPQTVEALKRAVPHLDRAWDAENKIWWVAKEYEQTILSLFPGFEAHLKQPSMFDVEPDVASQGENV